MHRSVSPARNLALWLLALFSGALAFLGVWVILDRLPGMEAVLDDGTATGSQVYGGQSWVVVGAAVLAAGITGLALTLAVAARMNGRPDTAGEPDPAIAAIETPEADTEQLVDDPESTEPADAEALSGPR